MYNTLVVIPARLEASRLPGKPMVDIAGKPMIEHVWRQACAAETGRVVVATDAEEVFGAIRSCGGEAVMTRSDHMSGSDRVFEAVNKVDPDGSAEFIVNLQGDLPTLEPRLVDACLAPLRQKGPHISTLAAPITDMAERDDPNAVKVVGSPLPDIERPFGKLSVMRALYFSRGAVPWGDGPLFHHIGIYGYRRSALERFVTLRPSALEKRERLEQLRALEDEMRIDVAIVDTVPIGVDTPEDLAKARRHLGAVDAQAR
ncbi:MAG: 3-deoxy-manno-octulosonate cytidylyltransferase [Pseudomonadota bacterium]